LTAALNIRFRPGSGKWRSFHYRLSWVDRRGIRCNFFGIRCCGIFSQSDCPKHIQIDGI